MPLPNSEGEIKYKIIKNKLPLKRKLSNSRSWQGLCILHGGMIESTMTGKDIGHFKSISKDFLPSGPEKGEPSSVFVCGKGGLLHRRNHVLAAWGGRMSGLEDQAFILEKQAPTFSSTHGCASLPLPSPVPLLSCLSRQHSWRKWSCAPSSPAPLPLGNAVTATDWQEGAWQRMVKLIAGLFFPISLRCCPAGMPWLLLFPTLWVAWSFHEFPKSFARSQKHLLSELRSFGKLAEMFFLDWCLYFIFFLIAGKYDTFPPEAPRVMPY